MQMSLVQDPPVLSTQLAVNAFDVNGTLEGDDSAGGAVFEDALNLDRYEFALCIVVGLLWWTFMEYMIHRYLFHAVLGTEKGWLIMGHFLVSLPYPLVPSLTVGEALVDPYQLNGDPYPTRPSSA